MKLFFIIIIIISTNDLKYTEQLEVKVETVLEFISQSDLIE